MNKNSLNHFSKIECIRYQKQLDSRPIGIGPGRQLRIQSRSRKRSFIGLTSWKEEEKKGYRQIRTEQIQLMYGVEVAKC